MILRDTNGLSELIRPADSAGRRTRRRHRARGAIVATRNVADFLGRGIAVVNPWDIV